MLIRGVSWDETGPSLSFCAEPGTTGDGGTAGPLSLPLSAGQWLRFTVHEGPRRCVGSVAVHGPTDSVHSPCPQLATALRGYQCGGCFARDDFRFLHDFHRSGVAPPGLRRYLGQPHWLYLATFADGATKVGTASQRSKFSRLAEQGAVVAQYVAFADDGRIVRQLEDLVSAHLGLTQQIRSTAKSTALLNPRPAAELAAVNAGHGRAVRDVLHKVGLAGFRSVHEGWARPTVAGSLAEPAGAAAQRRHAYPSTPGSPGLSGGHGLLIKSVLGPCLLAGIDALEPDFVVDLGQLKGRRITLGNYRSAAPAVQNALF